MRVYSSRKRPRVGDVIARNWSGTRKYVAAGWLLMVFERVEAGWMRVA